MLRRFCLPFLCALFLLGCQNSAEPDFPVSEETPSQNQSESASLASPAAKEPATTEESNPLSGVQYVRTNGSGEVLAFPYLVRLTTVEDIPAYYDAFAGIYYLAQRPSGTGDPMSGWLDAVESYDAAWFETHDLYFAILEEGSGTIRHEATLDGKTVRIVETAPYVTDDMAQWHILLEVDKGTVLTGIQLKEDPTIHRNVYSSPASAESAFTAALIDLAYEQVGEAGLLPDLAMQSVERIPYGAIRDSVPNENGYRSDDDAPVWKIVFSSSIGTSVDAYINHRGFVFAMVKTDRPTEKIHSGSAHSSRQSGVFFIQTDSAKFSDSRRQNQKQLPSPTLLRTPNPAPWSRRMFFTMDSPSPVPMLARL